MQDINTCAITGNLTRDPELKKFDDGGAVCKIRVANNGRKKEGDEWVDAPNYFDVVIWGRQGEATAEYCSKGRKVAITGKLRWREWESQDGSKRQAVEIHADTVAFMGSPKGDSDGQQSQAQQPQANQGGDFAPLPGTAAATGDGDFQPAVSSPNDDLPF